MGSSPLTCIYFAICHEFVGLLVTNNLILFNQVLIVDLVGRFVQSLFTRSEMVLQQAHANIWGVSWERLAISIRNSFPSTCILFSKPKHHQGSTWILRQTTQSHALLLHHISTLQWFGYFNGTIFILKDMLGWAQLTYHSPISCRCCWNGL